MTLYSWNVNGFRACLKKGFEDFFHQKKFHILSLQEIKLQESTLPKEWASPKGFFSYWNFAQKKGYSGVGVYTKVEPLSVLKGMGIEEHDQEGRMLVLEYPAFYLVNVYTPNAQRGLTRLDYKQKWDKDFLEFCKALDQKKPLVICGDLNVAHQERDLANPKSNYNKTAGYTQPEIDDFQKLLDAGFVDTFRLFEEGGGHYTWWSYRFNARAKNIGWRIDYFLVSERIQKKVLKSWIEPEVMGSDHCPIGLELDMEF
ncbi:MAG: exodeoxyribonuclease III [Planctomycetota bacterium]|nr:MAG: exodeoxyribonuclease III [Planctomycetota bacterium]